jgi:hypothetical protein
LKELRIKDDELSIENISVGHFYGAGFSRMVQFTMASTDPDQNSGISLPISLKTF